jgi:hypothetical protein
MDKPMIKLWFPERMNWIEYIVRDKVEIISDLEQIKIDTDPDSMSVVVDILQSNASPSVEEIFEWTKIFDRIVLINCETRSDIIEILSIIDSQKIFFLTVGHMNYVPKHMTIVNIETSFGEVRKLYHNTNYEALKDLDPLTAKDYYFDALLGFPKPHRDFVYKKIQDKYQDKIYTRYKIKQQTLEESMTDKNWDWPPGAVVTPRTDTQIWYSGNLVQFGDMMTSISHIVPIDIYQKTCYSIVAETYWNLDFVLLSEKTIKPLIAKRLFIVFGGGGYLAHLHRLGFQTFDSVIDESYDLEPDDITRWTRAFEQVEYLCNQPQEVILQKIQPILEHNYNVLVGRDWNAEYEQAIVTAATEF